MECESQKQEHPLIFCLPGRQDCWTKLTSFVGTKRCRTTLSKSLSFYHHIRKVGVCTINNTTSSSEFDRWHVTYICCRYESICEPATPSSWDQTICQWEQIIPWLFQGNPLELSPWIASLHCNDYSWVMTPRWPINSTTRKLPNSCTREKKEKVLRRNEGVTSLL